MPQPAEVRALADALATAYLGAWERIVAAQDGLLASYPGLSRAERAAKLKDLQQLVTDLMSTVDEQALAWVTDDLPRAYLLGAASGGATGLPGVDLDALAVLAADTYGDLLAATSGVRSSTKELIRELGRQKVTDLLVRGQTAQQAGAELAQQLAGHGISAVTYANGTRHSLSDYTDMLLRTKSAQAYNGGAFGAFGKAGVQYVEVFDGFGCGWTSHSDPDTANGSIRTLEEAAQQSISHPRCQRSFGGRPDLTEETVGSARPTQTPEQEADQRLVAQDRLLAVARRAAARNLDAATSRRAVKLIEDPTTKATTAGHSRRVAAHETRVAKARTRASQVSS